MGCLTEINRLIFKLLVLFSASVTKRGEKLPIFEKVFMRQLFQNETLGAGRTRSNCLKPSNCSYSRLYLIEIMGVFFTDRRQKLERLLRLESTP